MGQPEQPLWGAGAPAAGRVPRPLLRGAVPGGESPALGRPFEKGGSVPCGGQLFVQPASQRAGLPGYREKAIVERLKAQYRLSWFPETGSLHRVRFRILKDQVSVMVDTSGEGLHKRGYRAQSNEAPIKETLAASLCQLSRLRPDGHLIDPFCGSGTLLVEGALLALRIAPGLQRTFTAQTWTNVPKALWQQERDRARSLERRDGGFTAQGFDIDPRRGGIDPGKRPKGRSGGVYLCQRPGYPRLLPRGEVWLRHLQPALRRKAAGCPAGPAAVSVHGEPVPAPAGMELWHYHPGPGV